MPPEIYSDEQKRQILGIARRVVTGTLSYQTPQPPPLDQCPEYLRAPRGCFVTLHSREGQLRGCIGTFDATQPLIHGIYRMGVATTKDPRFVFANPVSLAECNDLKIEVSVLTPLEKMEKALDLKLGVDGIYIKTLQNGRPISGCFLPQVPLEQGWDVEQTLSYCCGHKMGLEADAWRSDPNMEFFRFHSTILEESRPGGP